MDCKIESLLMHEYFMILEIPFRCGRINMWSENEDSIPNFKFKILEPEKEFIIVAKLRKKISEFQGDFEWNLFNGNGSNYIISPISVVLLSSHDKISHEQFLKYKNDTIKLIKFLSSDEANNTSHNSGFKK